MHSSLVRLQNAFGFFTTVAFAVAALVALSDFVSPRTPSGVIKATDVQVVRGRPHYYSSKKEEYAVIKFSLDGDLSSLLDHWNTKHLFVYVTADWTDPATNQTNSAVIWDSSITTPSSDHLANVGPATLKKLRKSARGKTTDPARGRLVLKNQRPKYQITHPSGKLAEAEGVALRLHYNVQPWVGLLTWDQDADFGAWKSLEGAVSREFSLPPVKVKEEKRKSA